MVVVLAKPQAVALELIEVTASERGNALVYATAG
jgi:hypothetical protein